MRNLVIYFFPFSMDIVVSLLLFVGRHSLADAGASESVVGSVPLFFGLGYFLSGPIMRRIISRKWAKIEMLLSIAALALLALILSATEEVGAIQFLFCLVPFTVSLFFNAFQTYMLGISNDSARPLALTVSLYTFAWSLGFGLGPFVSGFSRNYFSWSALYLMAAGMCVVIGSVVLAFRPSRVPLPSQPAPEPEAALGPPLHRAGWLGVLIGLIGWLFIATYWPVIAAQQNASPGLKGLVEFAFAGAYSLTALAVLALGRWQHRPSYLAGFGLLGVSSLILFGLADGAAGYLVAASMMGIFTGANFLFSVYHCMLKAEFASKRIAVNEMMVGLGYLAGPILATLLHTQGLAFSWAFGKAAILLSLLILIQGVLAFRLSRKQDA